MTIDDQLADASAAYLAMWSALDGFNPDADRWPDPCDFGDSHQRLQSAENAIARFRVTAKKMDPEIESDIGKFEKCAKLLASGGRYGNAIDQFSTYLRRRGSQLSDQSVVLGKAKPTDTEYSG